MFDTMKKSEIKKAEAAANKFFGRKDCKVTGYSAKLSTTDAGTWYDVTCEICFNYEESFPLSWMIAAAASQLSILGNQQVPFITHQTRYREKNTDQKRRS